MLWTVFLNKARSVLNDDTRLEEVRTAAQVCDWESISLRFFSHPEALRQRAALVEEHCRGEKEHLLETCENILAHRFDLLGSGLIEMGERINWHRDYNTCYDWQADVDYTAMGREAFDLLVNPISDAELKYPWDLSNMMWIPSLAAADAMTGDLRYANAFVTDVEDWMERNPFADGVNWFCAMNVAMRAINWMIGFAAFAPRLKPELRDRLLVCLLQHGLFIAANLEIEQNDFRNNHYLTNIVGLYYLGHFFRDLEVGRQWLDFAKKELESEIQVQFFPDGVCFENSTSYHRLSAEMLMLCAMLGRQNHDDFSDAFLERLHCAVRFVRDIIPSNHLIPMFGDNDNGRMLQFYGFGCVPVRDHRHLLAVGGEFFDDDTLRAAGHGAHADAIWLTGDWNPPVPKEKDVFRTFHYFDSGYMGVAGEEISWLIRNARIQEHERGGHAHCDAMSFTLNVGGVDLIVDPGAYCYSSQFEVRNAFRSVEYHNTIQFNTAQMHEYGTLTFEALWRMKDIARTKTVKFEQAGEMVVFQGSFSGFEDGRECRMNRTMTLNRRAGRLCIADAVEVVRGCMLTGDDAACSRLTFGPDVGVRRIGYRQIELSEMASGKILGRIELLDEHAHVRVRPLWFAPMYGERLQVQQLEIVWKPSQKRDVSVQLLIKKVF